MCYKYIVSQSFAQMYVHPKQTHNYAANGPSFSLFLFRVENLTHCFDLSCLLIAHSLDYVIVTDHRVMPRHVHSPPAELYKL